MTRFFRLIPAGPLMVILLTTMAYAAPGDAVDPARSVVPPVPDTQAIREKPDIVDLGNQRYRIGPIIVDKAARKFRIEGAILKIAPDAPLEFLVVAKRGYKAYESLIEMDANAFEFNLACILIGLDRKPGAQPLQHFDKKPIVGAPVALKIEWRRNGKLHRMKATDLIRLDKGKTSISEDWVYTGSAFDNVGLYLAHLSGVLIGFVHDRDSIIQHRDGLGLGNYGAVTYRSDVVPPSGTRVTLTVENLRKQ